MEYILTSLKAGWSFLLQKLTLLLRDAGKKYTFYYCWCWYIRYYWLFFLSMIHTVGSPAGLTNLQFLYWVIQSQRYYREYGLITSTITSHPSCSKYVAWHRAMWGASLPVYCVLTRPIYSRITEKLVHTNIGMENRTSHLLSRTCGGMLAPGSFLQLQYGLSKWAEIIGKCHML